MVRLPQIAAALLSLALIAGATSVHAAPRKGGSASKKGGGKGSSGGGSAKKDTAADPLGEIGSGGSRGAPASATASSSGGGTPPQRGPTRIDFDDRLIQGQTNKSGAVYLYDRKELQTKSMVKRRETFRQEILSNVYDTQ
jgi:hypothetical protein